MADLVPYTWDWQKEYQEIRAELTRRWQYRLRGRPCPTELTNAEEIINILEQMVPILQRKINQELKDQALSAMQQIAAAHATRLTQTTRHAAATDQTEDMPRTPSELQLEQVRIMQHWAKKDARDQRSTAFDLRHSAHCGIECPYPDQCSRDGGGQRIIPSSTYYGNCLLYHLSLVVDAPSWKRLLGQRYEPAENPFILKRISSSFFYDPSHQPCLACIRRPWTGWNPGCRYAQGRLCLVRLEHDKWLTRGE